MDNPHVARVALISHSFTGNRYVVALTDAGELLDIDGPLDPEEAEVRLEEWLADPDSITPLEGAEHMAAWYASRSWDTIRTVDLE